ncbi:MAG TPA: phage major capsid protein [Pirellulaceae bacterium]
MSDNLHELRAGRIHAARQINDAAKGGQLSGEQRSQIERISADIDKIEAVLNPRPKFNLPKPDGDKFGKRSSPEYRTAYDRYLRYGKNALNQSEQRALSADDDLTAGYLVPSEYTTDAVIKWVDDNLPIRQLATKFTVAGAQSLGVPSIDTDVSDADWTTELTSGNEDTAMKFGKRELQPSPVIKRTRASNKLLKRAKNAEEIVNGRLAFKMLLTFEKAFLTANGVKRPLGVFTASSQGISTARDVSTGNTSTSIGGDGLVNALYSLKEGYLRSPSLRWIFHRDAVKQIRLLKDATTGIYYYSPSVGVGMPDTILGVPVMLSEFAPNTFTTGLYVGLVGDLSYYHIADVDESYGIQRLVELYALTEETGFVGRMESDGMPVLDEAFARVKLG